jgi:hypothetical protein
MVLQFGITALLLRLNEERPQKFLLLPALADLARGTDVAKRIDLDETLREAYVCTDGEYRTALDIQRVYVEALEDAFGEARDDPPYVFRQNREVLDLAWETLDSLARDPLAIDGLRDWPLKRELFRRRLQRAHGITSFYDVGLSGARDLIYLDALYHDCGGAPDAEEMRVLQRKVLRQLIADERVESALEFPPGLQKDARFPPIRSATRGTMIGMILDNADRVELIRNPDWQQICYRAGEETTLVSFPDALCVYPQHVADLQARIASDS